MAESDSDEEAYSFSGKPVGTESYLKQHATVVTTGPPTNFEDAGSNAEEQPASSSNRNYPHSAMSRKQSSAGFLPSNSSMTAPAVRPQVRVTPYFPVNDPARRHQRSLDALRVCREDISAAEEVPPRLVRDRTTGMLLPPDQLLEYTFDTPATAVAGGSSGAAAAASGDSSANKVRPRKDGEHYARSVNAVSNLREMALLQHLGSVDD